MGAALLLIEIQELSAHCQELTARLMQIERLLDLVLDELEAA